MEEKHNAKNQSIRAVGLRDVQALKSLCSAYKLRHDTSKELLIAARTNGRLTAIKKLVTSICAAISETLGHYPVRTGDSPVHTTIKLACDNNIESLFEGTDSDDSDSSNNYSTVEKIEQLLKNGFEVNAVNCCNETPLHYAVKAKEVAIFDVDDERTERIVEFLVNHGADVNAEDVEGQRPVHYAVRVGNAEAVKLLLNRGADSEALTNNCVTPLHLAIEYCHLAVVKLLLQCGPDVTSEVYKNCLATAVNQLSENSQEVIDALLDYGFTVEPSDVNSPDFFHRAVDGGYFNIVEELVNRGADIHAVRCESEDDFRKGDTPLHSAVLMNNLEVVELLVTHGVDINIPNQQEDTPIDYAARFDENGKITKILLAHGRTSNYPKILRLAVEYNSANIVQILSQDAPNITDLTISDDTCTGKTLLHFSALCGNIPTASLLLDKGACINAATSKKQTPLHFAVLFEGYRFVAAKVVRLLLEKGATVDAKDYNNSTPLLLACEKSSKETVQSLIEFGADIHARNNFGRTALHIAAEKKNLEAVKVLLKYGADLNIRDGKRKTPLDLARIRLDCDKKLTRLTVTAFRRYIFLMIIADMYVSRETKKLLNSAGHRVKKSFEDGCKKEIKRMKREEISKISVYGILVSSTSSLEQIMRNDKIKQGLLSYDYSKFPSYANLIKLKLREAVDRKGLLEQWRASFCSIGTEHVRLTSYCIEEIFSYLSNRVLKDFIDACK